MLIFGMGCGDDPQPVADKAAETTGKTSETVESSAKKYIVFFGNSITAGYQLNPDDAFAALTQDRLDSLGYSDYQVVNAGISGETSADGLARIQWTLKQPVDIFVLELGANDGLRGMSLSETEVNLAAILAKVREMHPEAKLVVAGMQIPPNLGQRYTAQFEAIYPKLAAQFDAVLIPFLLDGVAADPDLNLDDGIHPNVQGHQIVAETVWKYLFPLLES